jgi:hypothetical protein
MKHSILDFIKGHLATAQHFFEQPLGIKLAKWFKRLINYGLIILTIYQVYSIGLTEVLKNIPINPFFYIIFLLIYFTLPFSEYFVYKRLAPIYFIDSQWVFHRKRFYNTSFVGYSGEVYVYNWLKKYVKIDSKSVFNFVKDNNILSIIASWVVVALVAVWLLIWDKSGLVNKIEGDIKTYLVILFSVLLILVLLFFIFGKKFYQLNRKNSLIILVIHIVRSISVSLLQALQWFIIIPEAGYILFLNFVAIQMVISKIPFISGKDLIFTSLSIYLAKYTSMSIEVFTSLLVVNLVLNKILGIISLVYKNKERAQMPDSTSG